MLKRSTTVVDLCCGNGIALRELSKRLPKIRYYGIDEFQPESFRTIIEGRKRLRDIEISFHTMALDFSDPENLRRQLKELLGRKKADEIHCHLPEPLELRSSGVLKVLAEFLKQNGRIYHSFNFGSPLFYSEIPYFFEGTDQMRAYDIHAKNKEQIQKEAEVAGLNVEKYAIKEYGVGQDKRWYVDHGTDDAQTSEAYRRLVGAYSEYKTANHFIVLSKPKA